jgi:hypothetical protein
MAKTWYPIIDYTLCIECGKCITRCPHDVYNKAKAPVPVVFRPEACIDHCHGFGNMPLRLDHIPWRGYRLDTAPWPSNSPG